MNDLMKQMDALLKSAEELLAACQVFDEWLDQVDQLVGRPHPVEVEVTDEW